MFIHTWGYLLPQILSLIGLLTSMIRWTILSSKSVFYWWGLHLRYHGNQGWWTNALFCTNSMIRKNKIIDWFKFLYMQFTKMALQQSWQYALKQLRAIYTHKQINVYYCRQALKHKMCVVLKHISRRTWNSRAPRHKSIFRPRKLKDLTRWRRNKLQEQRWLLYFQVCTHHNKFWSSIRVIFQPLPLKTKCMYKN